MRYTQTTRTSKETRTREITEAELIRLMSQVMLLRQAGEDLTWHAVYTPDYRHLLRYELTRNHKTRSVHTTFEPLSPAIGY